MGQQRYTASQFITAMPGTGGIIAAVAHKVGCRWETAKKYIETYPTVKQAWQAERETIIDMAEGELFQAVKRGERWAISFVLKTIGRERGYVEQQEIKTDGIITVRIVYDSGGDHAQDANESANN